MTSTDRDNLPESSARERSLADTLASDPTLMEPRALEMRLGELIRRYVHARSSPLAESVVQHIEALCLHPESRDPALFCAYRRLAIHWRWLAAQHGPAGT